MGRNKFEDQIKEKLIQREITPSAGSWDKLSTQLNTEGKKQGFRFWWIGIAATIIGAIFIAGLVYNNDSEIRTPGIVETPVGEDSGKEKAQEPAEVQEIKDAFVEETKNLKIVPPNKEKTQDIIQRERTEPIQVAENNFNSEEKALTQDSPVEPENFKTEAEALVESSPLENDIEISVGINNVMAEIADLERKNGKVGADEVDSLLAKAATQISKNRQEKFSSGKIDAGDLLWDVEMEMENSFREKIFEVMKEGFLKARTAVANRNN